MSFDDRNRPDRFENDRFDDDFDDDDDDSSAYSRINNVGDAETLLRRAADIIATAPTMPLSSSPRIDREEMIELLESALERLPDELRQARWMLKERQEFVAKTRRELRLIPSLGKRKCRRRKGITHECRITEVRGTRTNPRRDLDTAEVLPR